MWSSFALLAWRTVRVLEICSYQRGAFPRAYFSFPFLVFCFFAPFVLLPFWVLISFLLLFVRELELSFFVHPGRGISTLVHGDDYASTGSLAQLDWLRAQLEQRFEMKTQVLGHSDRADVQREVKVLNRVLRATKDGYEYECDQRYVEIILDSSSLHRRSR